MTQRRRAAIPVGDGGAPDLGRQRALPAAVAVAAAVAALVASTGAVGGSVVTVPLVLTAVLLAAAPTSPFAQASPVMAGYSVAVAAGVSLGALPWAAWLAGSLAVGVVVFVGLRMSLFHPPACAMALLLVLRPADWNALVVLAAGLAFLLTAARAAGRSGR